MASVELKQSTEIVVTVGPFISISDGYTCVTGITIASADAAWALKPSGGTAMSLVSATWASAVTGSYNLTITAGILDTNGDLEVRIQESSTYLPVFMSYEVVNGDYWNNKYGTGNRGEPGQEAPPVTTGMLYKVDYLYKFLRNKIDNDGSLIQVYADDAATVDHQAAVSESAGTVTRGEFASGGA